MAYHRVSAASGVILLWQKVLESNLLSTYLGRLLQALFSKGYTAVAQEQLNAGLDEGWIPNATIFEYLIRMLCESGGKEEARLVLNSMKVRMRVAPAPQSAVMLAIFWLFFRSLQYL